MLYPLDSSRLELELERHAALIALVGILSAHHEPSDLFRGLAPSLRAVVPFDILNFALYDSARNSMALYLWDGDGWPIAPLEVAVEDSVVGWVWKHQEPVTIDDIARETQFAPGLAWLRRHDLYSYTVLPLLTPNSNLGALGFGSKQRRAFGAHHVRYLERVAKIVALCMDRRQILDSLTDENERLRQLLDKVGRLETTDDPAASPTLHSNSNGFERTAASRCDHPIAFAFRDFMSDPEQLVSGFFGSTSVGLAILDRDFRFVTINRALAEMNGIPVAAHLNKTPREILGDAADAFQLQFQQVLATGEPVLNFEVSAKLPRRSEMNHWVEHYFPIKDTEGKVQRIAAVVMETSKEKRLEASFCALNASLKREKDRLQVLLELTRLLAGNWDVPQVFPKVSAVLRRVLRHECAAFGIYDDKNNVFVRQALDFPLGKGLFSAATPITAGGPQAKAVAARHAVAFSEQEIANFSAEPAMEGISESYLAEGLKSLCCVPLLRPSGTVGALSLASTRPHAFAPDDLTLLNQVGAQLAIAMENADASHQIQELKNRLKEEKLNLDGKIHHELDFDEIVGDSPALKNVLEQVTTVAKSGATVLILGETGTGKELIARAIHRLSTRRDKSFIKVNCAAIPTGLLESELFGHEKGAFTGAISQKIGRMELADKGTLFLDEVGEIPLELQPKLLRVLQDQEFERLGSARTIKINVRLVAATNRDLEQSVAQHEFRSDLFYRLSVFPVRMPPLRERRQDVPMLVRHFVQKFAKAMDQHIESIPAETMSILSEWHWPGNVRELENFIERSVILSQGSVLRAPLAELSGQEDHLTMDHTLEGAEREHILRALRETGGVISGPDGAADRLGVKRTTLQSKMQRLKILRKDYCE